MNLVTERLHDAREFLQELVDNPPQLPFEPTLIPLLFAATSRFSTTSVADMTALIERSQKLASRVLSIANSACYALESKVTSLHRAVAVLGFNEVRSLVIALGTNSAFAGQKPHPHFDAEAIWRHQLTSAAVAKALTAAMRDDPRTQRPPLFEPDDAYAAALLHDIGKALLAARRPDIYTEISLLVIEENISFHEAELLYWGMDHSIIGAQLLSYWRLPRLLTDAINWHHAPDIAPQGGAEARLIAAADIIAHQKAGDQRAFSTDVATLLPEGTAPDIIPRITSALNSDKSAALAAALL